MVAMASTSAVALEKCSHLIASGFTSCGVRVMQLWPLYTSPLTWLNITPHHLFLHGCLSMVAHFLVANQGTRGTIHTTVVLGS